MRDGQKVSFTGLDENGLAYGDKGQVISADEGYSHVLWSTGSRTGAVMIVDHSDLAASGRQVEAAMDDGLEDSLEVGSLDVTAAREIFDETGEIGLLNTMSEQGHLASFAAIAEEAATLISTRIRNDPSFRAVAAHLDDDEADRLVNLAQAILVRDAFDLAD